MVLLGIALERKMNTKLNLKNIKTKTRRSLALNKVMASVFFSNAAGAASSLAANFCIGEKHVKHKSNKL